MRLIAIATFLLVGCAANAPGKSTSEFTSPTTAALNPTIPTLVIADDSIAAKGFTPDSASRSARDIANRNRFASPADNLSNAIAPV